MKELSMHEMVSVQGGGWFKRLIVVNNPFPFPTWF
jgi:hypothetical protein